MLVLKAWREEKNNCGLWKAWSWNGNYGDEEGKKGVHFYKLCQKISKYNEQNERWLKCGAGGEFSGVIDRSHQRNFSNIVRRLVCVCVCAQCTHLLHFERL